MGAEFLRPLVIAWCFGTSLPAVADIATDGTVGAALQLSGPEFQIDADLGARVGGNLFHSFERFNLQNGERATFSGPDAIENVIGRVTGGARSDIDGTIRSTIPQAALWFINPSGVVFGPNARLDLQGSFHVSTADEVRFADGAAFSAAHPAGSSFSVAAPEAFGFVGAAPRAVTVQQARLEVPAGETLALAGGGVEVVGGEDQALRAEGGRVQVAALASQAAVGAIDGLASETAGGTIRIRNRAGIDTSGNRGGAISLIGGRVRIEDSSFVVASSVGEGDSGGVSIAADEVLLDGSIISSGALGTGGGGPITVTADRLDLRNSSFITSSAGETATRAGGDIRLTIGSLRIATGSAIITDTFGAGAAGNMTVRATEEVRVSGSSLLSVGSREASAGDGGLLTVIAPSLGVAEGGIVQSGGFGQGPAGDVVLEVDRLTVGSGGSVSTSVGGAGAAGDLTITAREAVAVTGFGSNIATLALAGTGAGGNITITAPSLEVTDEAFVASGTATRGPGGAIDLALDRLLVSGNASIRADSSDRGPAGDVLVSAAKDVTIADDGSLTAFTAGEGRGGRIEIAARTLEVSDGALAAFTIGPRAGGRIMLAVDRLEVAEGGIINTETFGRGRAGDIDVSARQSVHVSGAGSRVTASSRMVISTLLGVLNGGDGGSIRIAAPAVVLADGGLLAARSEDSGQAGSIVIDAPDRLELAGAGISTEAERAGGGRITLRVGELLDLRSGSVISSAVSGDQTTTAGDITIDPRFIVLDDSSILARAADGRGGNIRIAVEQLIQSPGSVIDASAGPAGIDGTVVVSSPEADLSGGLVVLEGTFVDVAPLRERCAARRDVGTSSFTGVGRGGLPAGPEAQLAGGHLEPSLAAGLASGQPARDTLGGTGSETGVRVAEFPQPCVPWRQ